MSEEEKIAFNYYKGCNEKDLLAFEFLGDISKKQVKYMELLLNLIENQQKEIEERNTRLQEEINENCKLKTELYGNSISKDRIEELIKYKEDLLLQLDHVTLFRNKTEKEEKEYERLRIERIQLKELLNK